LLGITTIKLSKSSGVYLLLIFVPIAVALEFLNAADHIVIFIVAAVGLVPLAKLIGDSTENLAIYYGSTSGSLLNATFGNAAEIIIAIVAINAGLLDLVKAPITGAILGNILLIFGLSIIAGGFKHKEQFFNKENTGVQSSMLFLAVIGLAIPTVFSNYCIKTSGHQRSAKDTIPK
jgi:Ca2+:H+ antiporter